MWGLTLIMLKDIKCFQIWAYFEGLGINFNFENFQNKIFQSNLCWKIHNQYVFYVNIHIFVLKYLVQTQIIQNQFKISEGGKWNSHHMPCVYSSRMVNHYRICPIKIEIIHGRHRVVQIYTWARPLYSNFTPLGVKFEYKGPAHV